MRQSQNILPGLGSLATVTAAIVTLSLVVWMITFSPVQTSIFAGPAAQVAAAHR